jgi:hypothetical protein
LLVTPVFAEQRIDQKAITPQQDNGSFFGAFRLFDLVL